MNAHQGIARPHTRNAVIPRHKLLHRLAQMGNAVVINTHHLRQRSRRVGESGRCDEGRESWHGGILPVWCDGFQKSRLES